MKIEERLAPSILTVGIGDEVRWVNHRKLPVRIDFLGGALDEISCQRGFSNLIGMKKESATVGANESASLCFSKAGAILYNARMDAPLPGGKQIVQGEIKVGSSGGTATAHETPAKGASDYDWPAGYFFLRRTRIRQPPDVVRSWPSWKPLPLCPIWQERWTF